MKMKMWKAQMIIRKAIEDGKQTVLDLAENSEGRNKQVEERGLSSCHPSRVSSRSCETLKRLEKKQTIPLSKKCEEEHRNTE